MLTKTESTALLRYLARGLKNNTLSKAHGRQLMGLAGKIRNQRNLSKDITDSLNSFFGPTNRQASAKLYGLERGRYSNVTIPDKLKKSICLFCRTESCVTTRLETYRILCRHLTPFLIYLWTIIGPFYSTLKVVKALHVYYRIV